MKKILLFIAILGLFCVPAAKAEATVTVGELQEMVNLLQAQILQFQEQLDTLRTGEVAEPSSATSDEEESLPDVSAEEEVLPARPRAYFNPSSYTASEHTGVPTNVTIKVQLSAASENTVRVNYRTIGGTATAGSDYQYVSGTLTFDPGETSKTFNLVVLDDDIIESNEVVNLSLSSPVNATLGNPYQAVLTIYDNDSTDVRVSFRSAIYSVTEGDAFSVQVRLSKALTETITVDYQTKDGTAKAGQDYVATNGTLTFVPGDILESFKVNTIDDEDNESNEIFSVSLSNPTNAILGIPKNSILTIRDNDGAVTVLFAPTQSFLNKAAYFVTEGNTFKNVKIKLSKASDETVTVDLKSQNLTAKAGEDYIAVNEKLTFSPGETVKFIDVPTIDDNVAEHIEIFNLVLSNPANAGLGIPRIAVMTIWDDDGSAWKPRASFKNFIQSKTEGVSFELEVKLSRSSSETVTVDYETRNGTAFAGLDYIAANGTLTFAPGETRKTFEIGTIDDDEAEFSEIFSVILSSPTNAILGIPNKTILVIKDNDASSKVFFGSPAYLKMENGGSVLVEVKLSRSSTEIITVDYHTSDINAKAGEDYVDTSGTLTFASGETMKNFSVPIINDNVAEILETFRVSLSNPTNAFLRVPSNAIITIKDDDAGAKISLKMFVYSKVEGNDFTVEVKLNQASAETVTVDYSTSDGTAKAGQDYVTTNGTLTFAPGDVVKSFTVETIDDDDAEFSEIFGVSLSNPTNGILWVPKSAVMIIIDNDGIPKVSFSKSSYSIKEGWKAIITVKLSKLSDKTITVDYEASDGTAVVVDDYLPANGTITFKPLRLIKTFSVTTLNDNITEGDETINLTLSNPSNATLGNPDDAVLTIKE